MIHISNKNDCCGCAACVQVCPQKCISISADKQGFLYPSVDEYRCVDCGLCNQSCPIINQSESRAPLIVYAAVNPDDNKRSQSSSGGIFTAIAEYVIRDGGVVFGACFDNFWNVVHNYTEDINAIDVFRGSKYVQSRIGDTFIQARKFLNDGRKVLFSGTSCQIAGLRKFLRKEYNNLITLDVVCHGVPSPLVWNKYLNHIDEQQMNAHRSDWQSISFRDKSTGWTNYSFVIQGKDGRIVFKETHQKNLFMQLFLSNLSIRPSCFDCPAKNGKSGSDLTLADYWGVNKYHSEFYDDQGTSLILVNSLKGLKIFEDLNLIKCMSQYENALEENPCIKYNISSNKYYDAFWSYFLDNGFFKMEKIIKKFRPNYLSRIINRIKTIATDIIQ